MAGRFGTWVRELACKSVTGYTLSELAKRFARAADESEASGDGVATDKPYAQSVWVYSAVNMIARSMALVPLAVRNARDDVLRNSPISLLLNQPNHSQSWPEFVIELVVRLLLDGHVFIERRGMIGNRPSEIHIVAITDVRPDVRQDPHTGKDFAFRWLRRLTNEPLIPGDELHEWKLFNPYDTVYGMAPICPASLALYCDVATGTYNKAFFVNGARADVVFTSDDPRFTQEQANEALRVWNERHQGAIRGRKAAFMGNSLKPHLLGYTFADMEFPELKRLSKSEILAIFGVPDTMLGAQGPSGGVQIGGSNRKPDGENFMLNTVMPWGRWFCWFFDRVVTSTFNPTLYTEFNWRQVPILQDRLLDRAKEGREWIKAGSTFNDVNEKFELGFAMTETGNDWWVPSNMLPARLLMNGPLAADPGRAQTDPADAKDARKSLALVEAA